jgi:hypothetical protein
VPRQAQTLKFVTSSDLALADTVWSHGKAQKQLRC